MAELSIGQAVGAGFGVIRRRPMSVLLWGFVQTLVVGVGFALLAPGYIEMFGHMARSAAGGRPPMPPDFAGMMQLQGEVWLLNLVNAMVATILYCGVFRALIQPAQGRFGYLRVGKTELFLFLILVGLYLGCAIAVGVAMIPSAIIVGILVAMHAAAAAVIAGVLLGAVVVWALVYISLRLSMIGPTTIDGGELRLGVAWAMTKGRTWRLFLMGLSVFLILVGAELVLLIIGAIVIAAVVASGSVGSAQTLTALMQQPAALTARLAPLMVVGGLIAIPLSGAFLAIIAAPWARAYLDLRLDPSEAF